MSRILRDFVTHVTDAAARRSTKHRSPKAVVPPPQMAWRNTRAHFQTTRRKIRTPPQKNQGPRSKRRRATRSRRCSSSLCTAWRCKSGGGVLRVWEGGAKRRKFQRRYDRAMVSCYSWCMRCAVQRWDAHLQSRLGPQRSRHRASGHVSGCRGHVTHSGGHVSGLAVTSQATLLSDWV